MLLFSFTNLLDLDTRSKPLLRSKQVCLIDLHPSFLDTDECTIDTHNCDGNATCANTPGSFSCTCNTGYTGTGLVCLGRKLFLLLYFNDMQALVFRWPVL